MKDLFTEAGDWTDPSLLAADTLERHVKAWMQDLIERGYKQREIAAIAHYAVGSAALDVALDLKFEAAKAPRV